MSAIMRSEFDLFSPQEKDISVLKANYHPFYPLTSPSERYTDIQFNIIGDASHFLDFKNSYLYIKACVKNKDGTALVANQNPAVTNNFLHSLFQSAELTVNSTVVQPVGNTYAYQSYINNLLSHNQAQKNTEDWLSLYVKDEHPDNFKKSENPSYKTRSEILSQSKTFETLGRLNFDLALQPKYIIPNVDLKIKLKRSSDDFCLMNEEAEVNEIKSPYTVHILEAVYYIKKITPTEPIMQKCMSELQKCPAIYPINKVEIKTFTIPQSSIAGSSQNLLVGKIPNKLVLALAKPNEMLGELDKNPFSFKSHKLKKLTITLDNEPILYREINFGSNLEKIGYSTLLDLKIDNGLTLNDFSNGNFLILYDISSSTIANKSSIEKSGILKIDLEFSEALTYPLNVIVWTQFDGNIEIDKEGNVKVD